MFPHALLPVSAVSAGALAVDMFDLDGTVRNPWTVGTEPGIPHGELVALFRALSRTGMQVAVTGMSPAALEHLERQAGFRFHEAWVSYALWRRRVDGEWGFTGDPRQWDAFKAVIAEVKRICAEHEGHLDDETALFTGYFTPMSEQFYAAERAMRALVAPHLASGLLAMKAHDYDGGMNVLPADGGKDLAVSHFRGLGARIRIAAGDTTSDLPLLEAAEFPIVTRSDENTAPNKELVALVERRGVGYVCTHHNGVGLCEALEVARSRGVVTF